jgi:hypothetical protein
MFCTIARPTKHVGMRHRQSGQGVESMPLHFRRLQILWHNISVRSRKKFEETYKSSRRNGGFGNEAFKATFTDGLARAQRAQMLPKSTALRSLRSQPGEVISEASQTPLGMRFLLSRATGSSSAERGAMEYSSFRRRVWRRRDQRQSSEVEACPLEPPGHLFNFPHTHPIS